MILMIILLFLSILVVILTAIYLYQLKNKKKQKSLMSQQKNNSKDNNKKTKKAQKQLKDIFNLKVNNSIINQNDRYSVILKLGSIDYTMLSETEQESIENVLMQASVTIDSPIQFFTTTENIDTTNIIEKIKISKPLNEKIRSCKEHLIEYLQNIMESNNSSIIRSYVIISYDGEYPNAIDELTRKVNIFKNNLLRAKIQCYVLTDEEIANLLYQELNKNSSIIKLNLNLTEGGNLYVKKEKRN